MLPSGRYATGGFARSVEFFIFKGLKMPNYKSHEGGGESQANGDTDAGQDGDGGADGAGELADGCVDDEAAGDNT